MIIINHQWLKAKKRSILLFSKPNQSYFKVIFDPKNITNCGNFISFGQYYGDQLTGFYNINQVCDCVVSILKEFD